MSQNRITSTLNPVPSEGRKEMKFNILALKNEFRFAVECMRAVMKDDIIVWEPKICPPISRQSDHLFSDSIKTAIQHFLTEETAPYIDTVVHSWFKTERKLPEFVTLMNMLTTNFCDSPVTARKFLEYCGTVAEISTMLYISGYQQAPDYGIMCIFYCIKFCLENKPHCDFDLFKELEELSIDINAKRTTNDLVRLILSNRERNLRSFGVAYPQ